MLWYVTSRSSLRWLSKDEWRGFEFLSCEVLFPVMNGRWWTTNWQAYIGIALSGFDDSCLPHSDASLALPIIYSLVGMLIIDVMSYHLRVSLPSSLLDSSFSDPSDNTLMKFVSCAAVQLFIRYFPPSPFFGIWWDSIFNHDGLRKRDKFPSADNEDWIHEVHWYLNHVLKLMIFGMLLTLVDTQNNVSDTFVRWASSISWLAVINFM